MLHTPHTHATACRPQSAAARQPAHMLPSGLQGRNHRSHAGSSSTVKKLPAPLGGCSMLPQARICRAARRRVAHCRAQVTTTTTTTTTTTAAPSGSATVKLIDVALPLEEATRSIMMAVVPEGKGQAIQITAVASGSVAEQLGVKVGQKMRAILDPVRSDQMHALRDRPSLRFVTQTIAMTRRPELFIQLEEGPPPPPLQPVASAATSGVVPAQQAVAVAGSGSVVSSIDDLLGVGGDGPTVSQQLSTWYSELVATGTVSREQVVTVALPSTRAAAPTDGQQQQQGGQAGVDGEDEAWTDVQKRVKRRKDYMEEVSKRNDTPFFTGVLALVLLPVVVILAVAYFTGYLDNLYLQTMSRG